MLAPIRLTNAAAQLPLRGQVRRKETHPHRPHPYARDVQCASVLIAHPYRPRHYTERDALALRVAAFKA
jgi:hypothetical protein